MIDQQDFDSTIGRLDRCLSKMIEWSTPDLDLDPIFHEKIQVFSITPRA